MSATDPNLLLSEPQKTRLKRPSRMVTIAFTIVILAVCPLTLHDMFGAVWSLIFSDTVWTLEHVEDTLRVVLPVDAADIHFDGADGSYYTYLNLTFSASPKSAEDFARKLCPDGLHPHYDPLNAIDLEERVTYRYAVRFGSLYPYPTYFSYSPITPDSIQGTRCFNWSQFLVEIRLDQSSPLMQSIHVRMTEAGTIHDARAFNDFPMLVRGVIKFQAYEAVWPTICFEIDPLAFTHPKNKWEFLKNSTVQVSINGQRFQDAVISDDGLLKPVETDDKVAADNYFSYCVFHNWDKNANAVDVAVTPQNGVTRHYFWSFSG